MTTEYAVRIHCDRCADWVEAAPSPKASGAARTLVKHLKKKGWSRSTNSFYTDLCPACLAEERKAKPEAPKHEHSQ